MTDDNDTYEESVLAAEYALGLLTPGEAIAFEDVISVDPGMRDHYAAWAKDFATLTDDVDPVAPPPALEARITKTLFGVPEKQSIWSRFGVFAPVLGGLVAAGIVLVVLGQSNFLRGSGPIYVAEIAAEDSSLVIKANFDPKSSTLQMTRMEGDLAEGRSQELWLIAGENAPVSLGIWPQGQVQAVVVVPADLMELMPGGVLAVTDEPLGGAPAGDPMGSVLAAGPVTLL